MKLLDVCKLIVDCPHSTAKDEGTGFPLIRTPNIGQGRLKLDGVHRVSESIYIDRNKRATPQTNDLILAREAPVGNVAVIKDEKVCLGQRTVLIRPDEKKVDPDFLVYYFLAPRQQHRLISSSNGATVSHLNMSAIRNFEIDLPDMDKQKKIGQILSKIDDLVVENERINKNLFQQAQALYKDRFVDLQPFDGLMPEDWHLGTVSEIIELHDSKRIPLSSRERANLAKIYPYYGAASVMDYVDRYLFDGIYLLLGEDGTVVDSKGFPILQYVEGKFWVNNHAHIITGKNGFTVETLYLLFSLTNVQSIVTGAVQPKISQTNLNKVPVVIPSKVELSDLDSIVQPIFAQIRNLRAENDRLATTRDTLLPRLMSGELDVSDLDL